MKKVYIAGPISNRPEPEARAEFQAAQDKFEAMGYAVVNPMNLPHNHDKSWATNTTFTSVVCVITEYYYLWRMEKVCRNCNQPKSVTEFNKCSRNSDGHQAYCRNCSSAINKRRYISDRERQISRVKQWNKDNAGKVAENMRKSRARNPQRYKENRRRWESDNKDKVSFYDSVKRNKKTKRN